MTNVLAPRTKMLRVTMSRSESVEVGNFSSGILLKAPTPRKVENSNSKRRGYRSVFKRVCYLAFPGKKDTIHACNDPYQANVGPTFLSHKDETRCNDNFTRHLYL